MPHDCRTRIHDLSTYCDGSLTSDHRTLAAVSDLSSYSWRAALMDGTVVVNDHPTRELYHRYLFGLGIGATELIGVNGANLFRGILDGWPICAQFAKRIERGEEVEVFTDCEEAEHFIHAFGIPDRQMRSTRRHVTATLGDKEHLRRLGGTLGLADAFPEHQFVRGQEPITAACFDILDRYGRVIVKRPDLASGVGCQNFTRGEIGGDRFTAFVREFGCDGRDMVVEEWVEGDEDDPMVDYSVQYHVSAEGEVGQIFLSGQYIEDDQVTHAGNFISSQSEDCLPAEWTPAERAEVAGKMFSMTRPFALWARDQGTDGIGRIGFDLKVNRRRAVVLESNCRQTAATYPESVRFQLVRSGRCRSAAVAMRNIRPANVHGWQALPARLGSLAFDPATCRGVIVGNPLCMEGEHPKFAAVCVGHGLAEAQAILRETQQFLQGSRVSAAAK